MLAIRDAGPTLLPGGELTATTSILEELLIALMGHTGDIFVDGSSSGRGRIADPGACGFATAKDLRFISAPDRCIAALSVEISANFFRQIHEGRTSHSDR
jgi:hypothetical protein